MKKSAMVLAAVLSLNAVSPAWAAQNDADIRQEQLMRLIEDKGPKAALKSMSNEELMQARKDLREILASLKEDLTVAQVHDDARMGYTVRKVGMYGTGAAAVAALALIVSDGMSKGPDRGGGIMAGFIVGIFLGGAMLTVTAGGQVMVWLSPEEADAVRSKIDKTVRALDLLDARLDARSK